VLRAQLWDKLCDSHNVDSISAIIGVVREHGTRSCFVGGCRRPECRAAEAAYQRARRQSRSTRAEKTPAKKKKTLAAVPVLPVTRTDLGAIAQPVEPAGPGRVEAAVIAEIGMLSTASKRPGLVEGALAMARMLDSPLYLAQHPPAMARLQNALAELRVGADTRKGWLAEVRKMTPAG
jgi:hypothetical protein